MQSVFDSPEIATVQALIIMASYWESQGESSTMDACVRVIFSEAIPSSCGLSVGFDMFGEQAWSEHRTA